MNDTMIQRTRTAEENPHISKSMKYLVESQKKS